VQYGLSAYCTLHSRRWRLDDAGGEARRGDDLQHLEVIRARDLAMLDAGRLQNAVTLADRVLSLTFVLKGRPAVEDIDELEGAVVYVPLLHLVLGLLAVVADQVGDVVAFGTRFDPEIAILEDLTQARRPPGLARKVMNEVPLLVRHRLLHRVFTS
jgi:hypothetical protein